MVLLELGSTQQPEGAFYSRNMTVSFLSSNSFPDPYNAQNGEQTAKSDIQSPLWHIHPSPPHCPTTSPGISLLHSPVLQPYQAVQCSETRNPAASLKPLYPAPSASFTYVNSRSLFHLTNSVLSFSSSMKPPIVPASPAKTRVAALDRHTRVWVQNIFPAYFWAVVSYVIYLEFPGYVLTY